VAGHDTYYSAPDFLNCEFIGNTAPNAASIYSSTKSLRFATFTNCLFAENRNTSATATYLNRINTNTTTSSGKPTFLNCTFAEDLVPAGQSLFDFILDVPANPPVFHNCIITNNANATPVATLFTPATIVSGNTIILKNTLTNYPQTAFGSNAANVNNIVSTNPHYTDAATENYTPADGSPAINTGDNALYTNLRTTLTGETDLAGNARLVGTKIDRGAYEKSGCTHYVAWRGVHNEFDPGNTYYCTLEEGIEATTSATDTLWLIANVIPSVYENVIYAAATPDPLGLNNNDVTIQGQKGTVIQHIGVNHRLFNIQAGRTVVIDSCKMVDFRGAFGGFALNYGTLTLTHDTIAGCEATHSTNSSKIGGVIYNYPTGIVNIDFCTISNNSAYSYGGVVYNNSGIINIKHAKINNNSTMSSYGGVAYNGGVNAVLTIDSCSVIDNTALGGGGVIYNTATVYIRNSEFLRNTVTYAGNYYGGVIYNNQATVDIYNCDISHNSAQGPAGAIYSYGTASYPAVVTINRSKITYNNAKSYGGAIYCQGDYSTLSIDSSSIAYNTISTAANNIYGGAIFAYGTVNISHSNISHNSLPGTTQTNNWGGAIAGWTGCKLTLTCDTLNANNVAATGTNGQGGAIAVYGDGGDVKIKNCLFDGNHSGRRAGAIGLISGGSLATPLTYSIDSCTFVNNTANYLGGTIEMGFGASYPYVTGTITHSNFENNIAGTDGGAIADYSYMATTVSKCTFTGNRANDPVYNAGGGAIFKPNSRYGTATVEYSSFFNNAAPNGAGGAIYVNESDMVLNNCTFFGNSAKYSGGAIKSVTSSVLVLNTTITNNSVSWATDSTWLDGVAHTQSNRLTLGNGGGISNDMSELFVLNSIVLGNSSPFKGKDLYSWINTIHNGNRVGLHYSIFGELFEDYKTDNGNRQGQERLYKDTVGLWHVANPADVFDATYNIHDGIVEVTTAYGSGGVLAGTSCCVASQPANYGSDWKYWYYQDPSTGNWVPYVREGYKAQDGGAQKNWDGFYRYGFDTGYDGMPLSEPADIIADDQIFQSRLTCNNTRGAWVGEGTIAVPTILPYEACATPGTFSMDSLIITTLTTIWYADSLTQNPITVPQIDKNIPDTVVRWVVLSDRGCVSSPYKVTAIIRPLPSVVVESSTICAGEEIVFRFKGSPSFIMNYTITNRLNQNVLPETYFGWPTVFTETILTPITVNTYTISLPLLLDGIFNININSIEDHFGCITLGN